MSVEEKQLDKEENSHGMKPKTFQEQLKWVIDNQEEIRERKEFGWKAAISIMTLLLIFEFILPIDGNRVIWFSTIYVFTCIFIIMGLGLNIHTGLTGLVNFGVIFFVGIGAVSTGIFSVTFGLHPFVAVGIGILIGATFGFLMIYPTVRLRTDYFAIVTIALGEMLRLALTAEPTLRASASESELTNVGIADVVKPFQSWWVNSFGSNSQYELPYVLFLCFIATILVIIAFTLSQLILNSPFGRVLRGIREDDDVVESYGYNVLRYKGIALAIGGGLMAFAGGLWAWFQGSVFPDFMDPVRSTFLVWAVFIIGGKGNNWGMIIGSYIIVITDFRLRTLDDIGGLDINFLVFVLIGLTIIISMRFAKSGIIPEVPYRPEIEGYSADSKVFDVVNCPHCHALNRSDSKQCDSCESSMKMGEKQ